jgi:hypothetical protein
VLTVILIITVSICAVLTVIVRIMRITGRLICSANSDCDNNEELYMQCNSDCDNNGVIYM